MTGAQPEQTEPALLGQARTLFNLLQAAQRQGLTVLLAAATGEGPATARQLDLLDDILASAIVSVNAFRAGILKVEPHGPHEGLDSQET